MDAGGAFYRKGGRMDFVALIACIAAVLGWFAAGWGWLDSWCWRKHAERVEADLERVRETLGKCRTERDLLARECSDADSERVA